MKNATQAFVWIWLPRTEEPVVAGRMDQQGDRYRFTYGRSYLDRKQAIALSPFELPLKKGTFDPEGMLEIHSCLRDGSPDAWGRRVIQYQYPQLNPNELDYLLLSNSNRIGALDFQVSNSEYVPRNKEKLELKDMLLAAECMEENRSLPKSLQQALLHGTSIGGARPKVIFLNESNQKEYIAKFSSTSDLYNVIKSEGLAMRLARIVGINVSNVSLESTLKKDVLLVERFDRTYLSGNKVFRKLMLSGLSLLGLHEMEARYASYCDLADMIRKHFAFPQRDLRELYCRLIFNILIGNTDDHARNHAAFWDGENLELTPAYDLCPQSRTGFETTQAMKMEGIDGDLSTLKNAWSICEKFQISSKDAKDIIEKMILSIHENWKPTCDELQISKVDQQKLWEKSIFNPFCFQGFEQ